MRSRSGWARSGSRTASTAPSPGSIPRPTACAPTIPVGDGPNGIAVADGAVWVSNELSGTLSRIDPDRDVVVDTVTTGNRPQGLVHEAGALFVAVRASGAGHRGGRLTLLTSSGDLRGGRFLDPARRLHADGVAGGRAHERRPHGLPQGGRHRGDAARARSRRLASGPHRRRPLVHLPAAPGDPLLDRSTRPARGLPAGDRAERCSRTARDGGSPASSGPPPAARRRSGAISRRGS